MFNKALKIFAVLLAGFAGGAMAPWVLGWFKAVVIGSPADAVSIANTYIVFTTIIFVGVTVILAVAGYVFTQQFSASKGSQEHQLLEELKEKIKSDEKLGIALANSILENSDVKRHLNDLLESKIGQILAARLEDAQATAEDMQASADLMKNEAKAIASLNSQLNGNGKGGKS